MKDIKKIALASDHAGFGAKEEIKNYLEGKGYEVKDFGASGREPSDYPDFAIPAAESVASGENDAGIFFCGSGNGMNISANKVRGVRSAVAYCTEAARLAAEDTDCRVICFGARFMKIEDIKERTDAWLSASCAEGRHRRRVDKIENYEGVKREVERAEGVRLRRTPKSASGGSEER